MANGNAEGESGVTREIKMVCVTGASGFIASWLVKLLLRRGYTVRGTVRDLSNPAKVEHLRSLEGANERLQLVEADLLKEGSFDEVVRGCECVFHTASPFFNNPTDPQADLLDPAVKGTLNVLTACKKASSVKRVVVTSSIAAARFNSRSLGPDSVIDETCFSDREYCVQNKFWYPLSKTLAEEAAWKFSKENNLDIVTINPVMVIGTLLQPSLNTSSAAILNLMSGSSTFPNSRLGWVSLKDVAEAHILAYEVPSANGRYVMCERVAHFSEIVRLLSTIYPGVPLPNKCADDNPYVPAYKVSRVRAEELGVKFTPTEEALKETVESLIEKKMLTLPSRY